LRKLSSVYHHFPLLSFEASLLSAENFAPHNAALVSLVHITQALAEQIHTSKFSIPQRELSGCHSRIIQTHSFGLPSPLAPL